MYLYHSCPIWLSFNGIYLNFNAVKKIRAEECMFLFKTLFTTKKFYINKNEKYKKVVIGMI